MDNSISMSNTLGSQSLMSATPNQMPTGIVPQGPANYGPQPGPSNEEPAPAPPVKRGPGRPKGSGKKSTSAAASSSPKAKRPVGRPRKDGFPAGSVGPRRSGRPAGRPRKSAPARLDTDANANNNPQPSSAAFPFDPGFYSLAPGTLPQWQATLPSSSSAVPPMASLSTGPMQASKGHVFVANNDEWSGLARSRPQTFLQALLISLSAPNPVSSAGPSVEESFKSHLVSLAPNAYQKQAPPSIPSLYSILKTFWLPSSPSYFSLTASASTARVPSEHRFLYWDPQPLVFNGIACPSCSVPLHNNGRIRSGPIKVYDLEKPFFIIGCEYICKSQPCIANSSSEGRKFASTDSSILRSLPVPLKDEFPAYLAQGDADAGSGADVWDWQARGVSRSLWNMVRGCLNAGLGRDAIIQVIRAIQTGVSDDIGRQEEEEEAEDEHEDEQTPRENSGAENEAPSAIDGKQESADAYNNAWRANTAVGDSTTNEMTSQQDPGPSGGGGGGDTSVSPTTPAPAPQQYGFAPVGPYVTYPYPSYPYFNQQQSAGEPSTLQNTDTVPSEPKTAEKRPFSSTMGDDASEVGILEPSQKRTRHCCKCGRSECKGKGGRSFCLNACQDCGKIDCRGRNSRRPDKSCAEAWT